MNKIQRKGFEKKRHIEGLDNYINDYPSLNRVFKDIVNHSECETFTNDTMYVYCNFYDRHYSSRNEMKDVKIVERYVAKKIVRGAMCWDVCFKPDSTTRENAEHVIEILASNGISNHFFGYYYINKNVLLTCDFSHHYNPIVSALLGEVLKYLRSLGYCKKYISQKPVAKVHAIKNLCVSLGADPEFELIEDGEVVCAGEDDEFKGDEDESSLTKEWGLDGSSETVEARPKSALTPEEAVGNMRELFERVTHKNLSIESTRYSVGGHIHIGGVVFNELLDMPLLKLLDSQIGTPTLDMNGEARRYSGYRKNSAFETKPYGFEYRTPPAGIFYHPRMLELCYKIAKNTATKWYSGKEDYLYDTPEENLKAWSGFTDEEIKEYHSLIKDYHNHKSKNVVAAWVYVDPSEIKLKEYKINLQFSGDKMCSTTQIAIMEEIGKVTLNKKVKLHVFGLSEARGAYTFGITLDGCERYENDYFNFGHIADDGNIVIGLPWEIRTDPSASQLKDLRKALQEQIIGGLKCV